MSFKQLLALTGVLAVANLAVAQRQTQAQLEAYAQCGGIGWNGATACAEGLACMASNKLYSQCLPVSNRQIEKRAPQYETPGTPTWTYQTPTWTYQTPTYTYHTPTWTYPTPTYTYPSSNNYPYPQPAAPGGGLLGLL